MNVHYHAKTQTRTQFCAMIQGVFGANTSLILITINRNLISINVFSYWLRTQKWFLASLGKGRIILVWVLYYKEHFLDAWNTCKWGAVLIQEHFELRMLPGNMFSAMLTVLQSFKCLVVYIDKVFHLLSPVSWNMKQEITWKVHRMKNYLTQHVDLRVNSFQTQSRFGQN